MGIEEQSSRPEEEKQKDVPKTTLYYTPFNEKQKPKKGVAIDAEEKVELRKLENQLKGMEKSDTRLIERFSSLAEKMRPGELWARVNIAGENHRVAFTSLETGGGAEQPKKAAEKANEGKTDIGDFIVRFDIKKIEGREEPLFLHFKFPLTLLLRGGGAPERELKKLIEGQFGGTRHYYESLRVRQKDLVEKPMDARRHEEEKNQLKGALQKQGADIIEAEGKEMYSVVAQFPNEKKQLHISTIDKKEWSVMEVADQRKKEVFSLRPQEIISSYIEKNT